MIRRQVSIPVVLQRRLQAISAELSIPQVKLIEAGLELLQGLSKLTARDQVDVLAKLGCLRGYDLGIALGVRE